MLKEYPHDNLGPVYGPDAVFLPRTSFEPYGAFPESDTGFDRRLCSPMPLFVNQRVIVPEGAVHPLCLDLLERSGIAPLPRERCLVYKDRQGFEAILRSAGPRSLIVDHPHPLHGLAPGKYRVPRELLVRMVDKAYMQEWIPAEFLPPRQILQRGQLMNHDPSLWVPGRGCFLKSTGPYLNGGGFGVVFVEDPEGLAAACERLPGPDPLLLEAAIPHQKSYCVNLLFPEPAGSGAFLLGAAEQLMLKNNLFGGSRFTPPHAVPRAVLEAVSSAAVRIRDSGYIGMLGLDILDTAEGPVIVDLNPRSNFSTTPLIHLRRIRRQFDAEQNFIAFTVQISREREAEALAYIHAEQAKDQLFVFRTYKDSPAAPKSLGLTVMIPVGDVRDEEKRRNEMGENGLESKR